MKRIISAATCAAMLISMTSVFSGCSMREFFAKDDPAVQTTAGDDGVLTNGEWLSMVNDAFGMQVDDSAEDGDLAAAEEWGVIDSKDQVNPDEPVSDQFVTKTLMRASGFVDPGASDQEIIQSAIDHGVITQNEDLTKVETAAESLSNAKTEWSHQTFENKTDITYQEGVQDFTQNQDLESVNIRESDNTVIMPSEYAKTLTADSVYILPPNATFKNGCAYKVLSVKDNGDGTSTVKNVPAEIKDVYSDMDVSGGFKPDCSDVEVLNDNVTVTSGSAQGMSQTGSFDEGAVQQLGCTDDGNIQPMGSTEFNSVSFSVSLDNVEYALSVDNIVLNTDVDWSYGLFSGLDVDRIYMALDYDTSVSVKYAWEGEKNRVLKHTQLDSVVEPSIAVGKFAIYICPGLSVNFRVELVFKANGGVEVVVTQSNTRGFEMKGSSFRQINEDSCTTDFKLTGEMGIYLDLILALSLDYIIGEIDLVSLTLEVGPTLSGEVDVHENDMVCISINGYLKMSLTLELNAIFASTSVEFTGWDENNSPWKFLDIHLEDFKRVPKCTYEDQVTTVTTVTTEAVREGTFALNQTYLSLNEGSSSALQLKSVPTGCSTSGLKWSSSDTSKVTVDSNGKITAAAAGSATITVTSADGKYSASCAVVVHEDYSKKSVSRSITYNQNDYIFAA
ncbi:MAG: Ig-like domain-containing protein [Oscillospiraceae bacterium]|nr:Ig-like domain-containing protein [Oscillospiraceae bacterium]